MKAYITISLPTNNKNRKVYKGVIFYILIYKMTEEQKPLEILVIDDETPLRSLIKRKLELNGANVTQAEDGQQGIEMYEERYNAGTPYDVVFTDFNMPKADGIDVTKRIKELNPATLVYLISVNLHSAKDKVKEMPEELRPDKVMEKISCIQTTEAILNKIRTIKYGGSIPNYQS